MNTHYTLVFRGVSGSAFHIELMLDDTRGLIAVRQNGGGWTSVDLGWHDRLQLPVPPPALPTTETPALPADADALRAEFDSLTASNKHPLPWGSGAPNSEWAGRLGVLLGLADLWVVPAPERISKWYDEGVAAIAEAAQVMRQTNADNPAPRGTIPPNRAGKPRHVAQSRS